MNTGEIDSLELDGGVGGGNSTLSGGIAAAETRDDEHANSGRAAQFIASFERQLLTV